MSIQPQPKDRASRPAPAPVFYPLPHSLEAEQGVLGSMLCAPATVIPLVADALSAHDFYLPAHVTIFPLLVQAWMEGTPLDIITLTDLLRDADKLDTLKGKVQDSDQLFDVGGPTYVSHLLTFTPTAANVDWYLATVQAKARLRRTHLVAKEVAEAALLGGADAEELAERLQLLLTGLARAASTGSVAASMADLIPDAIDRLEARYEGRGKLRGIGSGLGLLDKLTGGWQAGQMIVVAAREKEGKSSLARQFVLEAAIARDKSVAFFSHEMSREEITDALISTRARVDSRRIENGTITEADFLSITQAANALKNKSIYVFDEADSSVLQFRANARRAVREFGCHLIVLDYLQLVNGTGSEEKRHEAVAAVSRNVKLAAKELGVPIIVLSQLNKDGATRESMAIQQDLDRLIVIEHENPEAEGDGKAWIKVKLSRGGPKGSVPVMWRPAITCFDPLGHDQEPDNQTPMLAPFEN